MKIRIVYDHSFSCTCSHVFVYNTSISFQRLLSSRESRSSFSFSDHVLKRFFILFHSTFSEECLPRFVVIEMLSLNVWYCILSYNSIYENFLKKYDIETSEKKENFIFMIFFICHCSSDRTIKIVRVISHLYWKSRSFIEHIEVRLL